MTNTDNQPKPTAQRHVRVFISSTFRDMQEERDLLVKHTFPELRQRWTSPKSMLRVAKYCPSA